MKFCKDCKHYEETTIYSTFYRCKRPTGAFNLVTGEEVQAEYCNNERASKSWNKEREFPFCGPEAKYFEPREVNNG